MKLTALPVPPPAETDSPRHFTRIVRDLVQGAWRRRLLIVLPIILMLPVSLVAAMVLPKAYMARSLMQLQESGRENPFSREGDTASVYRVQERFAGLQALFTSDQVLSKALGANADKLSPAEREMRIAELRSALSLNLIGGDFIEVTLAGARPEGLGKKLETVMASFLEELVPEQGGATAAQLMVNARRQNLDALVKEKEEAQRELATLLPNGFDDAAQRLAAIEEQRKDKGSSLAKVDTEVSRLRGSLGDPTDEQLEKEMAALSGGGSEWAEPSVGTDPPANNAERARDLSALQSLVSLQRNLSAETQDLGTTASALKGQIARFQELQNRLAELDQEIVAARETYETYVNRFSGTNAVRSVGILKAPELIRIIDSPRDPATASRSRLLYFLSGIMAGGLLGLVLAFVAERLDQRVRHEDEASEAASVPVLAVFGNRGNSIRSNAGSRRPTGGKRPRHLSSFLT